MPPFIRNDGTETFRESARVTFRRGVRLPQDTCRRIRDILILQLRSLGMDSCDIATVLSTPITDRQIRNRVRQVRVPGNCQVELGKILMRAHRELDAERGAEMDDKHPDDPSNESTCT